MFEAIPRMDPACAIYGTGDTPISRGNPPHGTHAAPSQGSAVERKGLGEKLFFSIGQINGWAALHMTPPWWGAKGITKKHANQPV